MKNMFLPFWLVWFSAFSVFGQESPATTSMVDSLVQVSRALTDQGDFDKALTLNEIAGKIALEKLGDETPSYGKVCFNHGWILQSKGNYFEAEKWYATSCGILRNALGAEHPDYAASLHYLGVIYYLTGNNYDKAEHCLLEAKAIREKVIGKDHLDYAETLYYLGVLYRFTGNLKLAETCQLDALAVREKKLGKEHLLYGASLNNLATLYKLRGDYAKAEAYYNGNIRIIEKQLGKNVPSYAGGIMNLSGVYINTGNHQRAESLLLEAKNILENLPNETRRPTYMSCMEYLGILYSEMGRYDLSETYHLKAKAIRSKVLGKEHLSVEMSLKWLSILYWKTGKLEQAAQYFSETAARQRAHLSNAARHFSEREVNSYLSMFGKEVDQHFSFAFDHCRTVPNVASACFDNALFHRGFLLNTSYLVRNRGAADPAVAAQLDQLKSCQRLLSAEYAKPDPERDSATVVRLETQSNTLEKDLARSVAGYGEISREVRWQQIHDALQPGEAALEFVHFNYFKPEPTDSVMYAALLLKPGMEQPLFIPLFEENTLEALLPPPGMNRSEYVSSLYQNQPLSGLVWSPVEPYLQGVKTVYYSPSGLLHRLNLAALPTAGGGVFSTKYELVQLGSSRQLATSGPQSTAGSQRTAVVFGGIQYEMDSTAIAPAATDELAISTRGLAFSETDSTLRGGSWKYLKNSEKETANVAAILHEAGIPAETWQGYAATEEAFKKIGKNGASPQILHVSTHGYFFPDTPRPPEGGAGAAPTSGGRGAGEPVFKTSGHPMIRSGLILAGANHAWQTGKPLGKREDGILTAYEISQMNLAATELVVLSACETGLGDIRGNEGVYGLQRAFKIAGAKNLIMSLWQVPDFQTQELMTLFYKKWLLEKMSIRQALHAAQEEMRQRGYEPFYWAGFVLVE